MASDANDYSIYLIDQDGKLVAKLDKTDPRAACLIDAADIVRAILKTDRCKSALAQMTIEFCEHFHTAWFLQEGEGTREERMGNVSCAFVDMFTVPHGFPSACLSERLKYEDVTGVSYRYERQGPFLLPSERILLNMVVSRKPTRFRCFLAS